MTNMKKLSVILAALMLAAVIIPAGGIMAANTAIAVDGTSDNTITVSATGTISATPDRATMHFGVETQNAVASTAQSENARIMQAVIDAIAATGIDKKDIQTTGYSIYTRYNYDGYGKSTVDGYVVNNSVTVLVRDIDKIGAVIDAAGKSGSNNMGGITFGVSNYDELYNEALKKAVIAAKGKGDALASALGVTISTPAAIVEGSSGYYYSGDMRMEAETAAPAATPVELGTTQITASITATYKY